LFAQTSAVRSPQRPFIIVSEVDSTNNYAMAKLHNRLLRSETAVLALHQTAGKGQRGRRWQTIAGENITMSTVFNASALHSVARFPFLLAAIAALGCYDFFKDLEVQDVTIKWPNDVYLDDRKAGGILIENILRGSSIEWSVIGTGINVNQTKFDELVKATSIRLATGKRLDILALARKLHEKLCLRFNELGTTPAARIMAEYNRHLFKAGSEVKLKKNNIVFSARILHVSAEGELVTFNQLEQRFKVGEVEFA
jgi:BirA family biotin operon repressor/biotin-[acetyl-CoA-carboxylase] ligase